jgi:peptide/nickel transport system permease protein
VGGFVLRKAIQYVLVLAVAVSVNFALPRIAPGDPLDYLLGEQSHQLGAEERAQILRQFGLDKPTSTQFKDYLVNLTHGDLGTSVRFGAPVREVIGDRLPWTLALVGSSIVLASLIGVVLGVLAAWRRGRRSDIGTMALVMFLDSTPIFWLGMLLLGVFSVELGWLPLFGAVPLSDQSGLALTGEVLKRLILPVSTLTLATLGGMFLVARYAMVGTLREDFLLMAEASGLSERRIVFGHALRNSLLPITTVIMLNLGFMLGGATVVETVFSYPGLGRLVYEGVLARDYPLLQGTFLLIALGVILCNFISDLLYPVLDPRIRRPAQVAD